LITTFEGNRFTFKIHVTFLTPGITIYPHLKVQGNNYYNGGVNNNGDILGSDLKFTNGQKVTLNGLTYQISKEWNMPALKIIAN
jgi:hypothetical protein